MTFRLTEEIPQFLGVVPSSQEVGRGDAVQLKLDQDLTDRPPQCHPCDRKGLRLRAPLAKRISHDIPPLCVRRNEIKRFVLGHRSGPPALRKYVPEPIVTI